MTDIRLSPDQLKAVLDLLSAGGLLLDADRRIIAMNDTAETLTGVTADQAIGRRCDETFAGYLCDGNCLMEQCAAAGLPALSADLRAADASGAMRHLTKIVSPTRDSRGNPAGGLEIFQDHSAFEELLEKVRHESMRVKNILEYLELGVLTVDRKGYITFFNVAAESMTRYGRKDLLGRSCAPLFGAEKLADDLPIRQTLADGRTRSGIEGHLFTQDGRPIPIRATYMALTSESGQIQGALATITDLSLQYALDTAVRNRYTFYDMVGKSPAVRKIFDIVPVIAESDATVLIEGPTGTGKDVLARVIHNASERKDSPLVKVNCAALPENLLESELFGYVKGAFTGADTDKIGRFQEANGGTIFLDEIGDLPLALQAKLLSVLEDQEFYPLGGRRTVKVDVRILSATNLGLENQVREKRFREDLFYRLNVMRLELPALRERREDIPLLINHILKRLCAKRKTEVERIAEDAMALLLNHDYPGNVRELENILEHALIICRSTVIERRHLPLSLQNAAAPAPAAVPAGGMETAGQGGEAAPADGEKRRILSALEEYGWHRGRTAEALGVDRTTLWRKMKKHGIGGRRAR